MGAALEVGIFPKGDHRERSEVQLRKGDRDPGEEAWNLNRGPRDNKRIERAAEQREGESANCLEAPEVEPPVRTRILVGLWQATGQQC